jgi:hypothetical protein
MGLLSKGVCLLHDNTCSHSVATTAEAIRQLEFGLPTCWWEDLAPMDYHVFGLLHGALHGQSLANDDKGHCAYGALIAIENFLCIWYQKVCELLHNML